MLVESWLARAARDRAHHPAIVTEGGSVSYAELDDAAATGAAELAARGVAPGERVALALPPGLGFAVALHACMRVGAVAVPLDPRAGEGERRAVSEGVALTVDEPLGTDVPRRSPAAPHDLDAPAIVVHTSGTTAAPRPVELTYGNWLWSAQGVATALGTGRDERWLCALPLHHVGGLSVLMRAAIAGSTVLLHERFDTDRVLAALSAPDGPNGVSLVPTTLARLLDAGLERPPALRRAMLGGAPAGAELLARARAAGLPVATTYGLTEACSAVTVGDAPLFCTRVAIGDDDEILVSGPTVAPGAGPVLHTGDFGTLDDEGRLRITGRIADTIVSGGENVAPAEVEAVLAEHPAVAEAAVHGEADQEWGEAVTATVVLKPGTTALAAELIAHCAARLAPHKVPKAIGFAVRLPRTASGKLLRRGLPGGGPRLSA